jgi:hypothetical protein
MSYDFTDSRPYGGSDRGVATKRERREIAARRRAAQRVAAEEALALMEAKIAPIQANGTMSAGQKLYALRQLRASGLSAEEFAVLRTAQGY